MTPELRDTLLLNMVPGVGPRLYQKLLQHFKHPRDVLDASESQLTMVSGLGPKIARNIVGARMEIDVQQEWDDCCRHRIELLPTDGPEYPVELQAIPDPPGVLYCRGQIRSQDRLAIAIVGSRHVSSYGHKVATQFSRGLAKAGYTIVSGLARGIDATAHEAALEAGGRTIAVLGSGLLNVYPEEHGDLAERITQSGALVSELPLHRAPHPGAFPQRNRIVSGLSLGVLVVEAHGRSGALITARHAMEQGREVFAVPGRIDQRGSCGCHHLIRDGAKLVQSIDDILEELGPLAQPVSLTEITAEGNQANTTKTCIRQPAELNLTDQETRVLQAIETDATLIDRIVSSTDLPVQRVLATISVLQARRLVRRISGNQVARV